MADARTALEARLRKLGSLPLRNGHVMVDNDTVARLAQAIERETRGEVTASDAGHVLMTWLLVGADRRRGIIGTVAVDISPMTVVGAVLAILGLGASALAGTPVMSPEGAIGVAGGIQALLSMISGLSLDERYVLGAIEGIASLDGKPGATVGEVRELLGADTPSEFEATVIRLSRKGAVIWDGSADSLIRCRRWC